MSFMIRNRLSYLCPYCKNDEYYIFKEAYTEMGWNTVSQIVCIKCRWVKKNVDLSTPWGPYHPDVAICDGNTVKYNTNQDMTIIPTPPEETLPECDLPVIPKNVMIPIKDEKVPDCLSKPIKAKHTAPADEPGVGEQQQIVIQGPIPEKPPKTLFESFTELNGWILPNYSKPKPKKPKKPKKIIKAVPPLQHPGDGSRWDEI